MCVYIYIFSFFLFCENGDAPVLSIGSSSAQDDAEDVQEAGLLVFSSISLALAS